MRPFSADVFVVPHFTFRQRYKTTNLVHHLPFRVCSFPQESSTFRVLPRPWLTLWHDALSVIFLAFPLLSTFHCSQSFLLLPQAHFKSGVKKLPTKASQKLCQYVPVVFSRWYDLVSRIYYPFLQNR